MRRAFNVLLSLALSLPGFEVLRAADAASDWKFYGGTKLPSGSGVVFFDAAGATRRPDGHIEVWTKGLSVKVIERSLGDKKFHGDLVDRTAQRIGAKYQLPYSTVDSVDSDMYVTLITYEVAANLNVGQPETRFLYELDCAAKAIRELSTFIAAGKKIGQDDQPRPWKHVAPETNAAALLKILCR